VKQDTTRLKASGTAQTGINNKTIFLRDIHVGKYSGQKRLAAISQPENGGGQEPLQSPIAQFTANVLDADMYSYIQFMDNSTNAPSP